jgi:hypothetical protein
MARPKHHRDDDAEIERPTWRQSYVGASLLAAGAVLAAAGLAAYLATQAREPSKRAKSSKHKHGKSRLQENAAKALRLKEAAGSQTTTPSHRTSHQGGVQGSQIGYTDTLLGREATYASNLKRSHNARTGDA